jgi:hypothetical protein
VLDEPDEAFARLGEGLRRASLALMAVLFVARAYFPSEDADTGTGLTWVFAILATTALAIAANLFSGTLRLRWSWADAAVIALVSLVAFSAGHAAERRPAITMAWEWGGLGLLYLLARNLPKSRGESVALAGVVVATAVAVASYALYQVPVEFVQLRVMFERNPMAVYQLMGIDPGSPGADALKNRMYSQEPFSTFALPNGPLALGFAVALENLRREGRGSRLVALGLAALPGLAMLTCLMLTKSRSAQIGLVVALLVLAWRARGAVPGKVLAATGVGLAVLVGGLIAAGVATKQLDIQVITEAPKSLRYRWEYWVGTWGLITDAPSPYASTGLDASPLGGGPLDEAGSSRTFWSGVGPANFATPYLRHKLPEASEEIKDPHNMVMEVWATAGVFAMLALLAALGIGLRETLGPAKGTVENSTTTEKSGAGWLIGLAGLGWLAVWVLGRLNPVTNADLLARWLILGVAWLGAVLLGGPLWRRRGVPAAAAGVGVLALAINLCAAGGIGIPSVAMALWMLLAIGLNLRDDRPCGRLREVGGLGPTVALACVWAALAGTFYGAVMPFWASEADRAIGDAALDSRPPAFEIGREAYTRAIEADHFNIKPWVGLAELEFLYWRSPERSQRKEPQFMKPLIALDNALTKPWRNPNNLDLRRQQASLARRIRRELVDAKPEELLPLLTTVVKATRYAASLYPTSATLRAELAQASAEIGMYPDAVREAKMALQLDQITPHLDKKLPRGTRPYLEAQIPEWEAKAKEPPPSPPKPAPRAASPPRPPGVAR